MRDETPLDELLANIATLASVYHAPMIYRGQRRDIGLRFDSKVTRALLKARNKYDVFALVRNEEKASRALGSDAKHVKFLHGDITKKETLGPACEDVDALVCSVGAQSGWRLPGQNKYTPKYVDYLGAQNLIEAAAEASVKKFVYVSSMSITRPWSFVHILLNALFGRVLYWKNLAEKGLRTAYQGRENLAYYIVRPGGLNNKPGGEQGILFQQGDTGMGSITRQDVATVCLACLDEECPRNVTFEIVNDSGAPAGDLKGLSSLVPDK